MSISHERISRRVISRGDLTGRGSVWCDEVVEHVGKPVEVGQLAGGRGFATLVESVDPDARDPQLVRRHDVVKVALGDMNVAIAVGARELVERLPVAMPRLI